MSADNGIYIAKFNDGYKVIHAQNIGDLDYYDHGTKERKQVWKSFFEKGEVFQSKEDAINYSIKLFEKESIVEYGIVDLGIGEEYENQDN